MAKGSTGSSQTDPLLARASNAISFDMETADQITKFQGVRDSEFYDRVDKILTDPATTDEQWDDIDAILFSDGLNSLLAEEG